MIQANELRIGNWVRIMDCIMCVKGISDTLYLGNNNTSDFIHDDFNYSLVEPIPLTTEMLERCGFIKCINADDDVLFKKQYFEIEYMEFFSEEKNGFYYNNNMPHETHIRYFHQLQNLYHALTGEELEIKNPA